MARSFRVEPLAVGFVGEQEFIAAQRGYRNRGLQRLQNSGEAAVRAREFLADAVGLGDVRHGGDPAGLCAKGVVEDLANHQPGQKVHPHVALEEPR